MTSSALSAREALRPHEDSGPSKQKEKQLEDWLARMAEGETRLCDVRADGAVFETDYHDQRRGRRLFTAVWLSTDGSGFLDEAHGDHILAIRY